jgi:hypothetical protein
MLTIPDVRLIRGNVLDWLEDLRDKNGTYGTYKMSENTGATLFSSCFAVFLRKLYNDIDSISTNEVEEWVNYIQSCQDDKTGLFIDPTLKRNGKFSTDLGKTHGFGYTSWQSTTFCLSALNVFDAEERHPLRFLDEWKEPDKIESWLSSLDWRKNTWCNGNLAMFLGIVLIHDMESTNSSNTKECVEAFFRWHDENQDPETGFWGTDYGTSIDKGLFGAMHQYLLYYYLNRNLKFMDKIVDNTLLLQQPDGLFSVQGGGDGCMDLDSIDTLVNMHLRIDYKRPIIEKAMKRAFIATLDLQGEDGGFLWTRRYRFGIKNWCNLGGSILHHRDINYGISSCKDAVLGQFLFYDRPRLSPGWTANPIPTNESDIFSTWFRSLNLALISKILPKCPYSEFDWGFLEAPGLGYFGTIK